MANSSINLYVSDCSNLSQKSRRIKRECGATVPHSFFSRSTLAVARELLGCEIVRKIGSTNADVIRVRIVETEAYLGERDEAAHCAAGKTQRAEVMWAAPGTIYVYFIYGAHFMLNFVTEKKGVAGAVLIRAVEPIEGLQTMRAQRGILPKKLGLQCAALTNGPGKLARAIGVDMSLNKARLSDHAAMRVCFGSRPVPDNAVVTTTRIGINKSRELPYRFYERGNPFVSKR